MLYFIVGEIKNMNIEEKALKDIIKQSIKEVLREERLNLYLSILPRVSNKEMKEIERLYGSPEDYNKADFIDKTDWLMK